MSMAAVAPSRDMVMNHILMSECMMTAAAQSPERGTLGETGVGLLRSALLGAAQAATFKDFVHPTFEAPLFMQKKRGLCVPPRALII